MTKKVTLEDLAIITQKGFLEVKTEMREGFDKVSKQFKQVDGRFLTVNSRLDLIEKDLSSLKSEVRWLRESLSETITRKEYRELDRRLHQVELKLKIS